MEVVELDNIIEEFEALSMDAERVQRETLKRILENNASAEYLQNLGLNGRTDPESFKACIPLVTYKDLEPYINKIIDGDVSPILTTNPITIMSLSSGTSEGKSKYIPWNDELFKTAMDIFQTSFAYMSREFQIKKNGKALYFIHGSKQFKTKGNLIVSTGSSNLFRNPNYKQSMNSHQIQYCNPDEVIFTSDFFQSLYCHLLIALSHRDEIQFISSPFAHTIIQAFKIFEELWEELCNDIEKGVLTSRVTDPLVRISMSKFLKPNPELAKLIHTKCSIMGLVKNWNGVIPMLFPNAKYVYGIMTGSMEHYLEKLRNYAGELPLLTSYYGASECCIGGNINPKVRPELASYVLFPQNVYFEFIPIAQSENHEDSSVCVDPQPVGLSEVNVGEEYELVVTSPAGLYRYKLGDVVKITGFYKTIPELKFIHRRNLKLNINLDKNTENDVQLAVEAAAKLLTKDKLEVVEFTSHVNLSKEPGHYVIFWEISGYASEEVLNECCDCLDKSFVDAGYTTSRKVNNIGPLELRIVKKGTFQKIFDHLVAFGTSASQYKTPKFLGPTHNTLLQILSENVAKNYFSAAYN